MPSPYEHLNFIGFQSTFLSMISNLSESYPDELFFSWCARYSERMQYQGKTSGIRKLLNTLCISIDFAKNLNYLIENLPPGHLYSVDELIQENTLFPLYSPFFPNERVQKSIEAMKYKGNVTFVSGLASYKIKPPEYLRYCPSCVDEDRKLFYEAYWHRLHQIPGVEVCPIHKTFLENSNFSRIKRKTYELITAENCIQNRSPKPLDLTNSHNLELLGIADDAAWLLKQGNLSIEWGALRKRYLSVLFEKRMASYDGRVYVKKLLTAFIDHYSSDFLCSIRCEVEKISRHNWLATLIHDTGRKFSHPLHHLLLIHFLGFSIENFLQLPEEPQPFGEGPWNCFNPVCPHFNKPYIKSYRLNYGSDHSTLTGIFCCDCGFSYSRRVFSESSNASHISKILSFGSLWEASLKRYWEDSSLLMRDIAERLKVVPTTVKTHAIKLGLPFPRVGARKVEVKLPKKHILKNTFEQVSCAEANKIDMYRNDWLSLLKSYPNDGRVALREKAPSIYSYLRKYDREWFQEHLPTRRRRGESAPVVDWANRDREWSASIRDLASHYKNSSDRPIRITTPLLGRNIGQIPKIKNHLDKLPLTAQAIAENTETIEDYAVRLIYWAANCFRAEHKKPTRSQLTVRAGIHTQKRSQLPRVQEAVSIVLRSFDV